MTLAGQDYVARRINHASLTRSTRADREEVQIEALYEPENPLSWLFPLRLAARLWVEILEENLADGLAPVTIFRGLALSTSVQGRRQVVRCASAQADVRLRANGAANDHQQQIVAALGGETDWRG